MTAGLNEDQQIARLNAAVTAGQWRHISDLATEPRRHPGATGEWVAATRNKSAALRGADSDGAMRSKNSFGCCMGVHR